MIVFPALLQLCVLSVQSPLVAKGDRVQKTVYGASRHQRSPCANFTANPTAACNSLHMSAGACAGAGGSDWCGSGASADTRGDIRGQEVTGIQKGGAQGGRQQVNSDRYRVAACDVKWTQLC
jgi:hypothetical protein